MKHLSYILLLFCLPLLNVLAAQDSLVINEKADQVSVDPFSNIYVLNRDNEFKKYNNKGQFEFSYTDLELSELSQIASDHPFKSMIYYPEYGLIKVFGNRLQVLAELNLNDFGFGEITALAPATGYQSFWIFDATDQKLVRINQNYQVEEESLLQNLLEEPFFPTIMKVRQSWIYAYDPDKGLFVFDANGIYSHHVAIKNALTFSVFDDRIFFSKKGKVFELEPYLKSLIPLNDTNYGDVISMAFRQIIYRVDDTIQLRKF